jgi:thymidine phosphorylase
MTDTIDPAVGIWLHRQRGETVAKGDPLVELHLASDTHADVLSARTRGAIRIGTARRAAPLIHEVIGPAGDTPWTGWATRLPL